MHLRVWFLVLLSAGSLLAEPLTFDSLTVGSTTYSNVIVLGASTTDLYFRHSQGIANVKLRLLSPELQRTFHFDPQAAKDAERKQAEADAQYQKNLATQLASSSGAVFMGTNTHTATYEESLADPISDQSFLGKAAPDLGVEKWLTEKPRLEGKFVLVSFWAPWSIPCRKTVPALNALQKQFNQQLVVVGLAGESEATTNAPAEAQFSFGQDSKDRLRTALGITSVPAVILVDPSGVVRYQGHPAALDEKKLNLLLAKFSSKE